MPAVEAAELAPACDEAGVALIPLVAPTTPAADVGLIARHARGFVYVVSVTGVTGERTELPPELPAVVERVRGAASVPVAVGFGVGTPAQAAAVGEIADGVIIGSRLVRARSRRRSRLTRVWSASSASSARPWPPCATGKIPRRCSYSSQPPWAPAR